MPNLRIKALTFDVTNTLIKASRSIGHQYADAARVHGVEADPVAIDRVFETTMAQKKREQPDYGKHHGVSNREWWADLVKRVFINAGCISAHQTTLAKVSDTLWRHFQEDAADAWEVLPNTREGLEALRAKGLQLGIVSNFDATLACTLRAHDLDKYFDFAVVSEECGMSKPDPAIFHKAIGEFIGGLAPNEVAHVGDEILNDYTAPRNVGMTAFLVDHEGHLSNAVMQKIVERKNVVRNLTDLSKLVEGTAV
jgi:putative hydrolase of the HAD superfamily